MDAKLNNLRARFAEFKQEHVFQFSASLSEDEKTALYNNLNSIDLADVNAQYTQSKKLVTLGEITPFPEITVQSAVTDAVRAQWHTRGLAAIRDGEVAVVIMAGGQGTRLGSSSPKGCYDVGLPSGKSLFQIQMERVLRLQALASQEGKASKKLPVYFMTSPATDAPTRTYFQEKQYFGLNASDVSFFQQGMLPCLTTEGKIIMENKTKVALAPDGNGGIYKGLHLSGSLADMKQRGVKYVHVFGIDNILIKVADPSFVGFCVLNNSTASNKVVLKTRPHEKVGVMCLRGGRPGVVEYSEITKQMAELRDAETGCLVYSAGNIAQHYFTLAFLESVINKTFPLHIANKNIPSIDADGKAVNVKGIKLEKFIFDSFAFSDSMSVFAVPRASEFSGVKNKVGRDSPGTARYALSSYSIQLARKAGATVIRGPDIHPAAYEGPPESRSALTHPGALPTSAPVDEGLLEINGMLSYQGEGLSALSGRTLTLPHHLASL